MKEVDKHRTPELKRVRMSEGVHVSYPLNRYFEKAIERLDYLEYGDPAEYLLRNHNLNSQSSELSSIWVPPRFTRNSEPGDFAIQKLLDDKTSCQLILADPGCGKSTLMRYLTCQLIKEYCQGQSRLYGVFVPLSTLTLEGKYSRAIAECAAKYVGLDDDEEVILELEKGLNQSCVLFDGFDELPIYHNRKQMPQPVTIRKDVAGLISFFQNTNSKLIPGSIPGRIMVTCRIEDYYEDKGSNIGLAQVYALSGFSPYQADLAIDKWHGAVVAKAEVAEQKDLAKSIEERRVSIKSALRENSDLAAICLTPLMLSALLTVYSDKNDVPSSVSQLCWRAINWFFINKYTNSAHHEFVQEYGNWLLSAIVKIGFEVQKRSIDGIPKSLNDYDLRRLVEEANQTHEFKNAPYEDREGWVTKVVSFLRKGHGILVKTSNVEYDFVHNVLREVLAGKALEEFTVPQRREFALKNAWNSPIKYWAGIRCLEHEGLHEISALVGELADDVANHNIEAIMACGEMLSEIVVVVDSDKMTKDIKRHVIRINSSMCELLKKPELSLLNRVRIGELLSILGDPRLQSRIEQRLLEIGMGEYEVGRANDHNPNIPKYTKSPASPQFKGRLNGFRIGIYLVTNSDFQGFIESGGYENLDYWINADAKLWVSQDEKKIKQLIQVANTVSEIHFTSELTGERLVEDEVPEHCEQMIKRSKPMYWTDPSYNRRNQPIVGVNWWEAMAFCKWLESDLKLKKLIGEDQQVRLPLEVEWEAVARSAGNGTYPWLEGQPGDCALVRAAFSQGGTPPSQKSCGVGLFEHVKTNIPIYDLVGNVWEWTGSLVESYGVDTFNQVLDESSFDDRIARGSSWLSSEPESTEITFRSFDPPYFAYEDLGFRIVIV